MTDKISLTNLVNLQNETTAVNAINANNAALRAALDNTLSRDGTSPNPMGSNLDMNSNRIINLPPPSSSTEPIRVGDVPSIGGTVNITNNIGGTGFVLMYPPEGDLSNNIWNVYDPYGNAINVTGTQTSGLQEAINYATGNGFNLQVVGGTVAQINFTLTLTSGSSFIGGIPSTSGINVGDYISSKGFPAFTMVTAINSATSVTASANALDSLSHNVCFGNGNTNISLSTTLNVPPVENWYWSAKGLNITATPDVGSNPGIHFDSMMASCVDMTGTVVFTQGTGPCVQFMPTLPVPLDGFTALIDCDVTISNVVGGVNAVQFNNNVGGIGNCIFKFIELIGVPTADATVSVAFVGTAGDSGFTSFEGNIIDIVSLHGSPITSGFILADSASSQSSVSGNLIRIGSIVSDTSVANQWGISIFGCKNIIDIGRINLGTTGTTGVLFRTGSTGNQVRVGDIVAATGISNNGTSNLYQYNGAIYLNGTAYTNP